MGNYQVRFWRAVEGATSSLTLIIMRKVATQLGISLAKVGRAVLNLPKRYDLFSSLKRSYRKRCEVRLQTA